MYRQNDIKMVWFCVDKNKIPFYMQLAIQSQCTTEKKRSVETIGKSKIVIKTKI